MGGLYRTLYCLKIHQGSAWLKVHLNTVKQNSNIKLKEKRGPFAWQATFKSIGFVSCAKLHVFINKESNQLHGHANLHRQPIQSTGHASFSSINPFRLITRIGSFQGPNMYSSIWHNIQVIHIYIISPLPKPSLCSSFLYAW